MHDADGHRLEAASGSSASVPSAESSRELLDAAQIARQGRRDENVDQHAQRRNGITDQPFRPDAGGANAESDGRHTTLFALPKPLSTLDVCASSIITIRGAALDLPSPPSYRSRTLCDRPGRARDCQVAGNIRPPAGSSQMPQLLIACVIVELVAKMRITAGADSTWHRLDADEDASYQRRETPALRLMHEPASRDWLCGWDGSVPITT